MKQPKFLSLDFFPRVCHPNSNILRTLELSSCTWAIAGGTILAANTAISKYGFLALAGSSSQMLLTSLIKGDRSLMMYSASVFCFVDCVGVVRWILS